MLVRTTEHCSTRSTYCQCQYHCQILPSWSIPPYIKSSEVSSIFVSSQFQLFHCLSTVFQTVLTNLLYISLPLLCIFSFIMIFSSFILLLTGALAAPTSLSTSVVKRDDMPWPEACNTSQERVQLYWKESDSQRSFIITIVAK